ncbi:MAG TPA: FtsX-like permease family protein [Bacteroidales bacterium]|nr:FtsX-like permease family protein [Bacteroidales bacterium]
MLAIKLAIKNLLGAGLRTFLNVFILSVAFVVIIMQNGFIQGWNKQARTDVIDWQYGEGQYWQEDYDPYDPFTLKDAHAPIPAELEQPRSEGQIAPVLVTQATVYPEGRLKTVLLKGIDPSQKTLEIPTKKLEGAHELVPAILGSRMAMNIKVDVGDLLLVRWRDANGMFDAREVVIAGLFSTDVPAIDLNQVWIPLNDLQHMMDMGNEATYISVETELLGNKDLPGWKFQDLDALLYDMDQMIKSKSAGNAIMYLILLALALLAIFDTQVLSIFRRQKEIGTFIAMGMTRRQVIGVFTVEGTMHAILALIVGAIWGAPLLMKLKKTGLPMPEGYDQMGLPLSDSIIPAYSLGLILFSVVVVTITTAIVSYMPARKIAKMNPNDAIRGKVQ